MATPEVAARLLLEFNFHEYRTGVGGVGDVVRGASTPSIGRPGVLRHLTGGAFGIDDREPAARHGHNDVVILVDVRTRGVTRPIERPTGDADLLIVDNCGGLRGAHVGVPPAVVVGRVNGKVLTGRFNHPHVVVLFDAIFRETASIIYRPGPLADHGGHDRPVPPSYAC